MGPEGAPVEVITVTVEALAVGTEGEPVTTEAGAEGTLTATDVAMVETEVRVTVEIVLVTEVKGTPPEVMTVVTGQVVKVSQVTTVVVLCNSDEIGEVPDGTGVGAMHLVQMVEVEVTNTVDSVDPTEVDTVPPAEIVVVTGLVATEVIVTIVVLSTLERVDEMAPDVTGATAEGTVVGAMHLVQMVDTDVIVIVDSLEPTEVETVPPAETVVVTGLVDTEVIVTTVVLSTLEVVNATGPDVTGATADGTVVAMHLVQMVDTEVSVTVETVVPTDVLTEPPSETVEVTGQVVTVTYVTTVVLSTLVTGTGPDGAGPDEIGPEEIGATPEGIVVAMHLVQIVEVEVSVTVETVVPTDVDTEPPSETVDVTGQVVTVVYVTTVVLSTLVIGAEVDGAGPVGTGPDETGPDGMEAEVTVPEVVELVTEPVADPVADPVTEPVTDPVTVETGPDETGATEDGRGNVSDVESEVGVTAGIDDGTDVGAMHLVQIVEVDVNVTVDTVVPTEVLTEPPSETVAVTGHVVSVT